MTPQPDGRLLEYRHSPHRAQPALRHRLVKVLQVTVAMVAGSGLPLRVLELGAGHGGYTEALLAAGCDVTVVEMSRRSLDDVTARYGADEHVTAVYDPGATLSAVEGRFTLCLCLSVLHHIPDYLAYLGRVTDRLQPGAALLTLQDPLWYPRVGRLTRTVDRAAYVAWRVGQGNVRSGFAAMTRRLRGRYPNAEAGDDAIVYHHVVRQGVDEEAVATFLQGRFARVEVLPYWSHHMGPMRPLAELARRSNTFAVRATGFAGPAGGSRSLGDRSGKWAK